MIIILTDKSNKIGSGNYYRSLNLYSELLKLGFNVDFIENSNKIITKNYLKKIKLFIIDTSLITKKNYFKLFNSKAKILCFDFFLNLPHHYNISIFEHKKIYQENKKYIGNKYINIRNGFLKITKKNLDNKSILICIGSSDIKNEGIKVYNYLKSKKFNVNIIKGEYSNYRNITKSDLIIASYKKFPQILNNYEYVISSGGSTLFESNFLKKKVFVLPQTKFEKNIAVDFYSQKAILGYTFQHIKNFDFSNEKVHIKQIVDGNGIKRIIKIINKILCT